MLQKLTPDFFWKSVTVKSKLRLVSWIHSGFWTKAHIQRLS